MKKRLIERFRYLWTWELFNALITFPVFILLMSDSVAIGILTVVATVVLCLLLLTGSGFAYLKYRDLKRGLCSIREREVFFYRLRWVMIALLLVLLIFAVSQRGADDLWLGLGIYLLAWLEYINYFHVQLMYDNVHDLNYLLKRKRLKRGLIAREFGW